MELTLTRERGFANTIVDRDRMLIDRATGGDLLALDDLVRKHQLRAYQHALRLTRDTDQASDLVAETFLRVTRSIRSFHGQSAFTTWLFRILTNCFLDSRQRATRRYTLSLDDTNPAEDTAGVRDLPDLNESAIDIVARGKQADTLVGAINRLPDGYRQMIVMYHCQDLSYEQIAAQIQIPIGTVKSRLNRARVALRDLLADKFDVLTATA